MIFLSGPSFTLMLMVTVLEEGSFLPGPNVTSMTFRRYHPGAPAVLRSMSSLDIGKFIGILFLPSFFFVFLFASYWHSKPFGPLEAGLMNVQRFFPIVDGGYKSERIIESGKNIPIAQLTRHRNISFPA